MIKQARTVGSKWQEALDCINIREREEGSGEAYHQRSVFKVSEFGKQEIEGLFSGQ